METEKTELPRKILSNTNRKYGKDVYHFTLPVSTCKEKTTACEKYCYGRRIWHNVKERYERNLEYSKSWEFRGRVIDQIMNERVRWVRIHPVGDFYDHAYFRKWIEIAEECYNTRFLAYTRNTTIDTSRLPRNFVLYFSVDHATKKLNPGIDRLALAFKPWQRVEWFEHYSPLEINDREFRICANRCENCRACWFAKHDVAFPIQAGRKTWKRPEDKYHNPVNIGPRKKVFPHGYGLMPPLKYPDEKGWCYWPGCNWKITLSEINNANCLILGYDQDHVKRLLEDPRVRFYCCKHYKQTTGELPNEARMDEVDDILTHELMREL